MNVNELIFASLLLVFLPLMLLRMTLKYRERRLRIQGEKVGQDNSLTTKELEALIEKVVRRSARGLDDRIDRLEHAVFDEGTVDEPLGLKERGDQASEDLSKTVGRVDRPRVR